MSTRTVDVERIRRYGAGAHTERTQAHRRWLAGMDPEHRAVHERIDVGTPGYCRACATEGLRVMRERIGRIKATLRGVRLPAARPSTQADYALAAPR